MSMPEDYVSWRSLAERRKEDNDGLIVQITALEARVRELEAALSEAREWIETDTDALDECHKPYDLDNPIDVETAQEVDDRRTWLTRTASETKGDADVHG